MKYKNILNRILQTNRGYTVIELVLVVFVVVILLAITVSPLADFRDNKLLISTAETAYSILNEARFNTLAAKNDFQYGVHFETGKIALFRGASYSAGDSNNEEMQIRSSVKISQISLSGGGSDVLFQRLTGKTNNFGSVTLQLVKNSSSTRIINIEKTGVVTINQ